jgi:hypothetical protein
MDLSLENQWHVSVAASSWDRTFRAAIKVGAGKELRTLSDVRTYLALLPIRQRDLPIWQHAAKLLVQSLDPSVDPEVLHDHIVFALLLTASGRESVDVGADTRK